MRASIRPAVLHGSWIGALTCWYVVTLARFGFHPTDQGWTLATSRRLLQGEVPHQDIVSARPLGYALLHTVDFALPGPLFLASLVVATAELIVATVALALLLTDRPLRRWGPVLTAAVAAAALVNFHTFPSTAWYTIDGIFVTACGWRALDVGLASGRTSLRRLGLVVLGFAVLTKQSFALAPVVGALMLVGHPAVRGTIAWRTRRWWARTAGDLACLASLPVLYVGAVALAGGLDDMVRQLRGARPVWFETMFRVWQDPMVRRSLFLLLGSAALLLLLARWRSLVPASFARGATAVAAVAVAATTLRVLYDGHLLFSSRYAVVLLWGLLGMSVVEWSRSGSLPLRPLLVAALAWMSALSWGYDSPALLGGSLVLGIVWLARPYLTFDLVPARVVTAVAAVGIVGMAAAFVTAERHHTTYRDRPRAELALGLGSVSPELRGIRTNEVHYAYITQIRSCLDRHPARRVAVLPDNAFVYPALDFDNPFPMDWLFTDELVGDAPQRVLAAAASLDEEGDYLVLFQQAPGTSDLYAYTALEPAIYQSLQGQKVTCGPFVGVWSPGQV